MGFIGAEFYYDSDVCKCPMYSSDNKSKFSWKMDKDYSIVLTCNICKSQAITSWAQIIAFVRIVPGITEQDIREKKLTKKASNPVLPGRLDNIDE